jgi:hypothetical protein
MNIQPRMKVTQVIGDGLFANSQAFVYPTSLTIQASFLYLSQHMFSKRQRNGREFLAGMVNHVPCRWQREAFHVDDAHTVFLV